MRASAQLGSERSVRRLFAIYAAASLIPVLVLGAVVLVLLRQSANSRALSDARAKADVIGRAVVAPIVSSDRLAGGINAAQSAQLARSVRLAIQEGDIARMRIRDLSGRVVYSDDGSGGEGTDPDALVAATTGRTVSQLTHLNADSDDQGPLGPAVVEIYEPLTSSTTGQRVGVLELYVPYAPIAAAIRAQQSSVTLVLAGGLALLWLCLLAVSMSVTGRLRRQVRMSRFLATHDPLTELPNRASFAERVASVAGAAVSGPGGAEGRGFAVAVLDLDRFKEINDVLGHHNGDALLQVLAERLKAEIGPNDVLARLGGDEFGLILGGVDAEAALAAASRLREVIARPTTLDDVPLVVEACVGVAVSPDDGTASMTLLTRADLALYAAKRQRLGVARYESSFDFDASGLALAAELGPAIGKNELVLCFQPKGDLATGRVSGVEALVRWQHPQRGLIYPDRFVPLVEQTDLIGRMTAWVVRAAARAIGEIDPTGAMTVAVNVSAASVVDPAFADEFLAILDDEGVEPARVTVEVTETALLSDPRTAAATMAQLSAAGVHISIDDFGAGQTSLGYLASLPISELKIDKSFVLPMLDDPRNAAIVRSVIQLAHSLGFTVTAEGVETAAVLHALRGEGCDTVQGYLLSRPVPQLALHRSLTECGVVLAGGSALLAG